MPVYLVNKHDTRVTGAPGPINYFVEYLFGIKLTRHLSSSWVHQIVISVFLHRFHKVVCHGYREVKIS